ncbi:YIP1 family protein [Halomicroarcula limicola]|uniref:YIP1 family protein n=1 Tax=Haloarcula limicola TaxID=1429915 RepID=A0A8J8C7Q7_9EURY|nr:YIP1 family protein [Halomicroarcula limicola]MBV0923785.1 YIP1 family protein [Halomicroarcula limicola]
MPSTVRTFLARPGAFFESRVDRLNGFRGGALALLFSVVATVILGGVLRRFTAMFTGTTTVDNPSYPGDMICEDGAFAEMNMTVTTSGCDLPKRKSVEISSLLWDEVAGVVPWLVVGFVVVWFVLAVALHVGAWLGGGTGRFGQTLEVAAWGFLPTLVTSVVGGAALLFFASRTDLSASSPEALLPAIRSLQSGVSGLTLLLIQLLGATWQAYVWAAGLRVVHEVSRRAAVAVAVLVALVPVLLS